jgi:two-component system cell cycle response regulator
MGPKETPRDRFSSGTIVKPGSVLVVDDDDALRMLVVKWLTKAGLTCIEAKSGEEALESARSLAEGLDAIVCDVMMPGLDGFAVLEQLKAEPATAAIPVMLLTAHANTEGEIVRGLEGGAVDHLAKPFSGPVLSAKVRALVERGRGERSLQKKLRFAEKRATIDGLTGLFNRRQFETRHREESAHARRHSRPLALVLFDLDHFKSINDTFGHEEGDRVLQQVGTAIPAVLRTEDSAFRYGGEEFVLLLRDCDAPSAILVGERLRASLKAKPLLLGPAQELRVITFSGGVAAAEATNEFKADDLVARADQALYRAKRAGRDRLELG